MHGVVPGCIITAIIGDITMVCTMAITMDMCGMIHGLTPISTVIIPVGIMDITMLIILTILTSVLVAQGGEVVTGRFPTIVPRHMRLLDEARQARQERRAQV